MSYTCIIVWPTGQDLAQWPAAAAAHHSTPVVLSWMWAIDGNLPSNVMKLSRVPRAVAVMRNFLQAPLHYRKAVIVALGCHGAHLHFHTALRYDTVIAFVY